MRDLSAAAIVAAVGAAAERWSDADFPARVRATAAIESRLGYSGPVVDYALDRLFFNLRPAELEAAIAGDLGSLAILDGPVQRPDGTAVYARGVDRVAIVSSDTTIGVALVPAMFALCAKCNVVVKDRADGLIGAFFATLTDERPEFGAAATARGWLGGSDPVETELLGGADVVVAFGADPALRAIRAAVAPSARFVGFGHRASIGYVENSALASGGHTGLLDAIATDTLLYDGAGCMSLHALFIAGDPSDQRAFLAELARAFERISVEFPPSVGRPQPAASAAAYRNLSTFRAAGGQGAVYAPARETATITFDPPADQPPPFLPRVLPVFPVSGPAEAVAYVAAHRLPIEALGVVDPAAPAALALGAAVGAVRITRFGQMQAPPLGAHHGGAARIADFVRWIDCE